MNRRSAIAATAAAVTAKLYMDKRFDIPPEPHHSWAVGDEPYVSLHFMGAEKLREVIV